MYLQACLVQMIDRSNDFILLWRLCVYERASVFICECVREHVDEFPSHDT